LGKTDWLEAAKPNKSLKPNGISLPLIDNLPMWGFKTPWYTIPGFIFAIPAIPWIMPCLFGVVLLRRAGNGNVDAVAEPRAVASGC
jgi:hypothetical protein